MTFEKPCNSCSRGFGKTSQYLIKAFRLEWHIAAAVTDRILCTFRVVASNHTGYVRLKQVYDASIFDYYNYVLHKTIASLQTKKTRLEAEIEF